jgi:hypothetical protein
MENLQCQIINIITHKSGSGSGGAAANAGILLIYSVLYLCIIIMIGIFLYWDTIYKTARRCSKCNTISKIIDENNYTETPFVYTIVIVNTSKIKKLADYVVKIIYDFNKMETNIEYGNTKGSGSESGSESGESVFVYRMNDYLTILEDLKALEKKKNELSVLMKQTNKRSDLEEYNKIALEYTRIMKTEEAKKAIELNNNGGFINSFNYKYFDLQNMKADVIENISLRINSNNYKYYAVDKNYNMIYSYTSSELINFTKNYSKNSNYPITIIDHIIFAKIQQGKNINI